VQDSTPKGQSNGITGPVSEFGTRMAACLTDAGWYANAAPNNSFEVVSDTADRARLYRDKAACGRQLGYDVYGSSTK
jgi:hypothetical protein